MCDHSEKNRTSEANSSLCKGQQGFSLVEVIVVMVVFLIVIAITMNSFDLIVKQFNLQTRNVESNIEGVLGLELMRSNIAAAGFGLPQSSLTYDEAANAPYSVYNEPTDTVPRAIRGGNNVVSADSTVQITGTDYLVIKATSVGTTTAAQRWTYMPYTSSGAPKPKTWSSANLAPTDFVIANKITVNESHTKENITAGTFEAIGAGNKSISSTGKLTQNTRSLVSSTVADKSDTSKISTQMNALTNFAPADATETILLYGVSTDETLSALRMPFNRADFYVRIPASSEFGAKLPDRCAPNTGILYKAIISQKDGTEQPEMPLLDCVADMQVVYSLVGQGEKDTLTDSAGTALSASDLLDQLGAVSVYILTHEGRRDPNYTYPNATIGVGPGNGITSGTGSTFNLSAKIGTGWQNFRWKVYHMTVKPKNLYSVSNS